MTSEARRAPKRVVIVIRQFFPLAAGAETQALRQAKSYIAMGYPTRVITARHDRTLPKSDTVEGVPVTRLSAPGVRFLGSMVFLAGLTWHLVTHARDYDAVLVFHLKQAAMVTALTCRLLRKRAVITDQAAGEYGDMEALRNAVFGGVVLWGCRKAPAFISGSSDITDELVSAGIERSRIHFIPNGVPVERFGAAADRAAARRSLGLGPDAFVVVNIGRHTAQKDLKTLIAGWREIAASRPGSMLLLVGDGDERQTLEGLVSQWGLTGTVRFEGWRQNVPEYLAAADVFASSSVSEGTHLALGEAMAAGLPVAATPVGGARDYVTDGESGIFLPVGDSGGMARALERLASDGAVRVRMGKAAASAARRLLDQDETARRHLEVLAGTARKERTPARIRIVHLIATLDRGGSENQMAQLATRLDRKRFDTQVLCLTRGGPVGQVLESASIPYLVIGKKGKVDIMRLLWLARRFFMQPPCILHTWLFTSNTYGRLAAIMGGVKHMVAAERSTDPWKTIVHRGLDSVLATVTNRIIANSGAVTESLVQRGIPASKITVIPNGVDTERFRPMEAVDARFILGLQVETPCFGFVGRLAFEKRPDVFVQVARAVVSEIPNARAVIFGEGPMEKGLKEQTWRFRSHVTFFGDCAFPELCHASIDCLVLTSQWEGSPNVVLEAMACGRPVVAVRMPATEELIEDGRTGLLVEDSIDAISAGVVSILKEPGRAAEMGRLARERVEKVYSLEKMVSAYEELYLEILNRERRNRGNS